MVSFPFSCFVILVIFFSLTQFLPYLSFISAVCIVMHYGGGHGPA